MREYCCTAVEIGWQHCALRFLRGFSPKVSVNIREKSRTFTPGKTSLLGHFLHSRIPPVENGPFRLESSGPSYRQSSGFIVFVIFLEVVGVREYCCTAVEIGWQLCASRAFSASNGSTNPRRSELVAFGLAESRQSYVRGVALSREPPKLQQAQPL